MKRIYARFNLVGDNYLVESYKIVDDTKEFRVSQVKYLLKRDFKMNDSTQVLFINHDSDELAVSDKDHSNNKPKFIFKMMSYNEVAEEIKNTYQFMIEQDLDELKQEWLNYKE